MKTKIIFLLTSILLFGCEKIDHKIEQSKDKLLEKVDQKVKEKTRDLTELEEKNADILIPYYDKLITKKRISMGNVYLIGDGYFLKATYEYDYGDYKNYYTVTFKADQKTQNIVDVFIQQTEKN